MKISVITVSYNCCKTIERTIKSVIAQDFHDYEYIVIDGKSTDGTCDIIRRYKDRISYFVSEPDDGIYDAMNKGIKAATGDVINFQGGDDYLLNPGVLRLVNEKMEESGCSMAIGQTLYGGDMLDTWPKDLDNLLVMSTNHQALFVRRDLFDKYGLFDYSENKILADYEWTIKAYLGEKKIEHIEKPVCYYNPEGISRNMQTLKELYGVRHEYIKKLGKEYLLDRVRNDIRRGIEERLIRELYTRYSEEVKSIIEKYFSHDKKYCIYGFGKFGRECFLLLKRYGIKVYLIFDKNKVLENALIDGVEVKAFAPDLVQGPIIVSTKRFLDNIEYLLDSCGFIKGNDYLEYSRIRDELFKYGIEKYTSDWFEYHFDE